MAEPMGGAVDPGDLCRPSGPDGKGQARGQARQPRGEPVVSAAAVVGRGYCALLLYAPWFTGPVGLRITERTRPVRCDLENARKFISIRSPHHPHTIDIRPLRIGVVLRADMSSYRHIFGGTALRRSVMAWVDSRPVGLGSRRSATREELIRTVSSSYGGRHE